MKVVIFCGGMGIRMGEATQKIPKPMITVNGQPILWHIMNWYASWGHTEFILCLGYRAETVTGYFGASNGGSGNGTLPVRMEDQQPGETGTWQITFLDTGVHASVGDRLRAARPYVGDDDVFLCTYGDGLTDAPLDRMIERLLDSGKTGLFMSVRPRLSYHVVDDDDDGNVRSIDPMATANVRINGGFLVLRRSIFEHLELGGDLMDVSARLAQAGEMITYRHDGFWAPMDTMKDKQDLDTMAANGTRSLARVAEQAGHGVDAPTSTGARDGRAPGPGGRLPLRRHRDRLRGHHPRADRVAGRASRDLGRSVRARRARG